jgi:hypothetical protein
MGGRPRGAGAVLTAAHVFEQASVGDIVIALPRENRLLMLRSTRVRVVAHPHLDIALLWFEDRAVGARLCANWSGCPLRRWCIEESSAATLHAIAGYPATNARRADRRRGRAARAPPMRLATIFGD